MNDGVRGGRGRSPGPRPDGTHSPTEAYSQSRRLNTTYRVVQTPAISSTANG